VPCLLVRTSEEDSAFLALVENLQRCDLHYIEEAAAIAKLIETYGISQEETARRLGRSQSAVANKLRLLRLYPKTRRLILEHSLSERHARALLRVKSAEDRQRILSHVVAHSLNVKQTEEYIDRLITPPDAREETRVYTYQNLLHGITRAIELTRSGGLTVRTLQTETDSDIIYTIQIPKPLTQ
jgi:ParB family chromosome partitioning protein